MNLSKTFRKLLAASFVFLTPFSYAENNQAIKLVVGFSAGGSNDIVARIVAKKASEILNKNIIVVNQPGASGMIAAEGVAKAKPDGQTLLIASPTVLAIAPYITKTRKYNPLDDFVGIGTVAMNAQVIAVNPKIQVQNLKDLSLLTKERKLSLASAGASSLSHLTIEMLRAAGMGEVIHVPFKGGLLAANDTIAGHVDGVIMDIPPLKPFVQSGQLKAIATTGNNRSNFLPDVPTAHELGYQEINAVNWFAIVAPKGLDGSLADKLHAAFSKSVKDPEVINQLANAGIDPMTQQSREDFNKFLQEEIKKWNNVITAAKIAEQ